MDTQTKKGGISVETANIFPVIKRWLYSEKDIFLREIVSNATDAVTKIKRLQSLGKISMPDEKYRVDVVLDTEEKTITVRDNGIGMSEDELTRYNCQIALSGALEFIEKYEGESNSADGIIGHFGLGFYSAFMISDKVEIYSKSYTDAPAVHWICDDNGEYEMSSCDKTEHGTSVVMHVSSEGEEYLNASKLKEMLDKYCSFMPVEIFFKQVNDGAEEKEEKPINETTPLWLKQASECSAEDYNEFYKKVFRDFKDPLFYIHINADYPLNFKGILFFPKIANEYESLEGQVKLYYNQVFVSDNIKEVIPDYMIMLKGVLDCPELPLNVSRSYLQTNTYVSKLSAHIVKKVADKLNSLYNTDRETFEKVWEDIKVFIEYACLRDKKFYDRVKDSLLVKLTDDTHLSINEYLEKAKDTNENTVYYTTDKALQAQYISLFEAQNIQVACFDHQLDTQFISMLEQYLENVNFIRVDADVASALKGDGDITENTAMAEVFKKASKNEKLDVKFEALKTTEIPAILNISEESRRFEDMMRMYGGNGNMGLNGGETLVVNNNSPLISKLSALIENDKDAAEQIASYIYKLSVISQRKLSAQEMQEFLADSFRILEKI
ncbi:MAG: molecular chaperone HtpG [Clostridia bacterium]|nr:molecular chaperone HtpG [Clostridia bacterium]